jgi:glyoxylase-like metal-dependent hydrolase (beta-lactamase superfamily II)
MKMLKKTHSLFTRRHLISGSTSLAATGMVLGFPEPSLAKAPFLNTSAPAFYRFKLGAIEATVISDGPLNFPDAGRIFTRAPDAEIRKLLADEFLSTDAVRMEQNILILNTGDKLIMFDTGILSMKPNPSLPSGRILKSMLEAGIKPEDIDAIVLTHLHIDHAGGIMSEDGKTRNFPNAQIFTTEADFNFWQSEKLIGTPAESSRNTVLKNIVPNKDRLVMVKDGQEILPGIQAIASHGHTVGHMSYMITSGGKSLCLTGDIAHHSILLRSPKMSIVFDTDPAAASASRIRMCEMLVSQKIPALIFHLPWPGIGHIAKEGDGFRFVPSPILPG